MNSSSYLAMLVVFLLLTSCRKQQGTVIARVGDAVLTLEAASLAVDSSRGSADGQLRAYVATWVTAELLHQEAQREDVDETEKFHQQVQDVTRQLAVQAYLDKHLYADTLVLGDSVLHNYFTTHSSEFFLREDIIKLNMVVFAGREHASTFAATVSQSTPWQKALEKKFRNSKSHSEIVLNAAEQYYSRRTINPPELWKVATTLSVFETSFPVRISTGYAVMQPTAVLKEGTPADFDFVRDEVYQRVQLEQRRLRYEELLTSLRTQYTVQLLLPSSDTTRISTHE